MFLILSLIVLAFAFWFSSFLAEIILSSKQENLLHPGVRSGVGFFISVAYFSASWQIMTIQNAWKLGWIILILYAYGRHGHSEFKNITQFIKRFFFRYLKAFGVYMAGGILFFLPLLIGNNYGPFSEGGGDLTIYADGSEFLTDKHLTSFGQEQPTLNDRKAILNSFLDFKNSNKTQRYAELTSDFREKNEELFNPPNAIVQAYRLVKNVFFLSSHYAPYAQFYFFSTRTNYHIYFGVQAFLYACILYSIWSFIFNLNRKIGIFIFAIAAASHGLISVHYNHYAVQATAIAATALVLASVSSVPVLSWAGGRIYGAIWLYISVVYTHFLALISPLILIALKFIPKEASNDSMCLPKGASISRQIAIFLVMAIIIFLLAMYLATGVTQSYGIIKMALHVGFNKSPYFGEAAPVFSLKWLSFAFGFLSQQHFQPFVREIPFVLSTIKVGVVFGITALVVGFSLMIHILKEPVDPISGRKNFYLIIYGVLTLLVVLHLSLINTALYSQAKNAQNLLILLYVIMLMPYAFSNQASNKPILTQRKILGVSLVIFFLTLIIPRLVYTGALGLSLGRGSIMEASYFKEIKKIFKLDNQPFVLFEPRKSSDVYLNIQPLAGAKMVTTRHLLNKKRVEEKGVTSYKIALAHDFIEPKDLPHVWIVYARGKKRWPFLNSLGKKGWPSLNILEYIWRSERLLNQKKPRVLLFADNYERNVQISPLSGPSDLRMFSYINNGAATLYQPAGIGGQLKVTIAPVIAQDYDSLVKEAKQRVLGNEFGKEVNVTGDGKFVFFKYQLSGKKIPSLKAIAHYSSKYFINIQFNGEDL